MLYIRDPYTGEMRDQLEYHCRGEAHVARPLKPEDVTDIEWGDYLFFFTNTKGIHFERWVNASGHRKWFNAIRNTVTDEFLATYRPDEDVVKIIKELNIDIKDIKSPHVLAKLGVKSNIAEKTIAKKTIAKKTIAKKTAKKTVAKQSTAKTTVETTAEKTV